MLGSYDEWNWQSSHDMGVPKGLLSNSNGEWLENRIYGHYKGALPSTGASGYDIYLVPNQLLREWPNIE